MTYRVPDPTSSVSIVTGVRSEQPSTRRLIYSKRRNWLRDLLRHPLQLVTGVTFPGDKVTWSSVWLLTAM